MHEWLHRCLNVFPFLNEHFLRYERWKESKADILTLSHDIHATTQDLIPWRNSLTYHSGQSLAWQNSQHFATTQLVSLWNNVGSLLRLVIFLYHFLTLFFVNPTCQYWNKATMKESWVSCGTDHYAVQGGHGCCFCSSESLKPRGEGWCLRKIWLGVCPQGFITMWPCVRQNPSVLLPCLRQETSYDQADQGDSFHLHTELSVIVCVFFS